MNSKIRIYNARSVVFAASLAVAALFAIESHVRTLHRTDSTTIHFSDEQILDNVITNNDGDFLDSNKA